MQVKQNSPMVAKIDIHKYGSNKLRKNLYHIHEKLELSKTRLQEPIIKGRNYKSRNASKGKSKENAVSQKTLKKNVTKLEDSYE